MKRRSRRRRELERLRARVFELEWDLTLRYIRDMEIVIAKADYLEDIETKGRAGIV